jgi:hypothetical protein
MLAEDIGAVTAVAEETGVVAAAPVVAAAVTLVAPIAGAVTPAGTAEIQFRVWNDLRREIGSTA